MASVRRKTQPAGGAALANLASALKKAGRLEEAFAVAQRAVQLPGAGPDVWFNFGNLLRDLGKLDEAEAAYRKAMALQPRFQPASVNLARMLAGLGRKRYEQGDAAGAEPAYREALRLEPRYVDALIGLGMACKDLGRTQEAIECWNRALSVDARNGTAHNNLGAMYRTLKRLPEAESHLRAALALAPGDSMAAANLAHALLEQGATTEAMSLAQGILQRRPDDVDGHMMLGFAQAYQGEVEAAIASFMESHRLKPQAAMPLCNALFASLYSDQRDAEAVLALHRELAAKIAPAAHPSAVVRTPHAKLRVGYLSPDLRSHPVTAFFEPILAHHDFDAFEIHCYSTAPVEDDVSARLRATGAVWHACSTWSDDRIAAQIAADGIDLLVDLAGHTAQNRAAVLRARPAPVQMLYIGYPGTSGIPEVDYLIADERICPPGSERFYSERILRMAGSFWCFRPPHASPAPAEAPLLRNGHFSFGSFNALQKMTPATVRLWARILQEAPGSRLVLKSLPFADAQLREAVRERFTAHGVDGARIDVLPPSIGEDFLAEYGRLDLALDPIPYNGGTTTFEALWMGVPVLTLAGERFCSRMGASILQNVGLGGLVARTPQEYVELAVGLAREPQRLAGLRDGLRERLATSPCCDAPRAARELEAGYRNAVAEGSCLP